MSEEGSRLVARLRNVLGMLMCRCCQDNAKLCAEAADEIERLTEALAASEGYLSYERSQVERLTCERDDTQKLAESLQNKWANRPLSYPDSDVLIAENDKLRAALAAIRDDRVIQGMSSALFAEKTLRDAQ